MHILAIIALSILGLFTTCYIYYRLTKATINPVTEYDINAYLGVWY